MDEEITYPMFAALEGESFEIQLVPGETVTLVLAFVSVAGSSANSANPSSQEQADSFSLVFHGPQTRFLPQATYQFVHAAIGTYSLFIVPIGSEGDHYRYEAVFNRLARPRESTP
jgi:hypothetical protein